MRNQRIKKKNPVYQGQVRLHKARRINMAVGQKLLWKKNENSVFIISVVKSDEDPNYLKVAVLSGYNQGKQKRAAKSELFLPMMDNDAVAAIPIAHSSWEFLIHKRMWLYNPEHQGLVPYKMTEAHKRKYAVIMTIKPRMTWEQALEKVMQMDSIEEAKKWMGQKGWKIVPTKKK